MREYGMFTARGNRRIGDIVAAAEGKIETRRTTGLKHTFSEIVRVYETAISNWQKLEKTKTMSEAGDTAVREAFGAALERVAIRTSTLDFFTATWRAIV